MCAVATATNEMLCALDASGADHSLFDAAKGQKGVQNNPDNADAVDVGPGQFDQTDLLGGGSCISDLTINVINQSVTLPFSNVCAHLAMLGNVLLAVTFLLCARIVTRG